MKNYWKGPSYLPELTGEQLRDVLDYDPETGLFSWRVRPATCMRAGDKAGTATVRGYISISIAGRGRLAHRLAWLYMTNEWPTGHIDHINGNKSDNRFCNLRQATPQQNTYNRKISRVNTSGFKGVSAGRNGKWQATIRVGGRCKYLGEFTTPEQAHEVYIEWAREHFGEFMRAR